MKPEERRRWLRNCDGETNPGFHLDGLGSEHPQRCPWALLSERREVLPLVDAFIEFRATGLLPFQGALNDQPNHVVEAFEILSGALAVPRDTENSAELRRLEAKLQEMKRRAGR